METKEQKNRGVKVQGLTAIIIAKNEEKNIGDCLGSVKRADEILVVDTGSTDKTVEIAKKHGARVVEYPEGGYSDWRNRGAKEAEGDWLLYVDADEKVTTALRDEIELLVYSLASSTYRDTAFAIPRRNILLGKEMKYGGWWPDYVVRLIKRDSLIGWEGELHEQPKIKGEIGKLREPLVHTTHRSIKEMIEKTNKWSEIEAKLLYKAGHPPVTWWRILSAVSREFWDRGVRKLGFLDGIAGIIEIIYQMFSRMVTYTKLWELQLRK